MGTSKAISRDLIDDCYFTSRFGQPPCFPCFIGPSEGGFTSTEARNFADAPTKTGVEGCTEHPTELRGEAASSEPIVQPLKGPHRGT